MAEANTRLDALSQALPTATEKNTAAGEEQKLSEDTAKANDKLSSLLGKK